MKSPSCEEYEAVGRAGIRETLTPQSLIVSQQFHQKIEPGGRTLLVGRLVETQHLLPHLTPQPVSQGLHPLTYLSPDTLYSAPAS